MSLLAHALFVSQRAVDDYSTEYVESLRRWITLAGGRRELNRSDDQDASSISWGNGPV